MKAYEIALFVICLSAATLLLAPTGIFSSPTVGMGPFTSEGYLGVIIGIVVGGGIAILGFVFKLQAALIVFGSLYGFATTTASTIMYTVFKIPGEIIGVVLALLTFVGVWAAYQIAGAPGGTME